MPGILIADDNRNIRYLFRVFVETQTPFKICGEAENGTDAIEKAKQLQPELILLDLSMPLLTGVEAAPILKRMLPQTKIVLFSLHMDDIPKSLIAVAGIDLAISKANGIVGLAESLNSLLQSPQTLLKPTPIDAVTGPEIQKPNDKPKSEPFKAEA
jgi:DNA-binding NarL/FixJ family response regulator